MAEQSAIAWTRSTFNPWIGCTKIGPGCDHCYAAVSTPARSMKIEWGPGKPRHRTAPQNWSKVRTWEKLAAEEKRTGVITPGHEAWGKPGFWPVFCASLADVFDNEVPKEWRAELFELIKATPNLSWLIVTKRIGNAAAMIADAIKDLDIGYDPEFTIWPWPNVRIMITVTDQAEADRDIPKLLALGCKNGVSYEPALGPINFTDISDGHAFNEVPREYWEDCDTEDSPPALHHNALTGEKRQRFGSYSEQGLGLDWIIIGGESDQPGAKARPFNLVWALDTIRQCNEAGVRVFFKQAGSNAHELGQRIDLRDRSGSDLSELPPDLRVQEFPDA